MKYIELELLPADMTERVDRLVGDSNTSFTSPEAASSLSDSKICSNLILPIAK